MNVDLLSKAKKIRIYHDDFYKRYVKEKNLFSKKMNVWVSSECGGWEGTSHPSQSTWVWMRLPEAPCAPWEWAGVVSSSWCPATYMGYLGCVPGSCAHFLSLVLSTLSSFSHSITRKKKVWKISNKKTSTLSSNWRISIGYQWLGMWSRS